MIDREQEARRDLGSTAVRPGTAAALAATLALLCIVPALLQVEAGGLAAAAGAHLAGAFGGSGFFERNARLREGLRGFELALEESSPVRSAALPPAQWIQTALLATGNRKVMVGSEGWLYFRPDVESLVVPGFLEPRPLPIGGQSAEDVPRTSGPAALAALARLGDDLRARDLALAVLVVPGKTAIEHPAKRGIAIANRSLAEFLEALAARGTTVLDAAPWLAAARDDRPLYLRTDTHWTPRGMDLVAQRTAEAIRPLLPAAPEAARTRRAVGVERAGDLLRALRLPERPRLYREEGATIDQVLDSAGAPLQPDPTADLLVLGDSFTNIYDDPALGWGEGAGFAEQLAYHLRRPVDRLAITGGGPAAPLAALTAQRLAGKRVVLYQVVAHELLSGDWTP
jgi:alginate O-acetyltransferase complex protein AlgJ